MSIDHEALTASVLLAREHLPQLVSTIEYKVVNMTHNTTGCSEPQDDSIHREDNSREELRARINSLQIDLFST